MLNNSFKAVFLILVTSRKYSSGYLRFLYSFKYQLCISLKINFNKLNFIFSLLFSAVVLAVVTVENITEEESNTYNEQDASFKICQKKNGFMVETHPTYQLLSAPYLPLGLSFLLQLHKLDFKVTSGKHLTFPATQETPEKPKSFISDCTGLG